VCLWPGPAQLLQHDLVHMVHGVKSHVHFLHVCPLSDAIVTHGLVSCVCLHGTPGLNHESIDLLLVCTPWPQVLLHLVYALHLPGVQGVGIGVGNGVGYWVGDVVRDVVGYAVGKLVGVVVGCAVGYAVGATVGYEVG